MQKIKKRNYLFFPRIFISFFNIINFKVLPLKHVFTLNSSFSSQKFYNYFFYGGNYV